METGKSKRATGFWQKANGTLEFHRKFIEEKVKMGKKRCTLEVFDLLLISNFKGGNATIPLGNITLLNNKLKKFSTLFSEIDEKFGRKLLRELNHKEYQELIRLVENISTACYNSETGIEGVKISYMSALMHVYFPELIPILDRRVLRNLGIATKQDENSIGQVKDIQKYYVNLLNKMRELSQTTAQSIREIDYEYFIKELK